MTRLIGKCGSCGGFFGIHALFVGDQHNLVLEGQCLECMERIVSSIQLTDIYKMSMEERRKKKPNGIPLTPPLKGMSDHDWYKAFGIKED